MPACTACGADIDTLHYTCNYCGKTYCPEHRLPENHHCTSLYKARTLGPEFRTWINDKLPISVTLGTPDDTQPQDPQATTSGQDDAKPSETGTGETKSSEQQDRRYPPADSQSGDYHMGLPDRYKSSPQDSEDRDRNRPEPMDVEYTVGTTSGPEYDTPPDVELKPEESPSKVYVSSVGVARSITIYAIGIMLTPILLASELGKSLLGNPRKTMFVVLLLVGSVTFGPVHTTWVLPDEYGGPIDSAMKETGDATIGGLFAVLNQTNTSNEDPADSISQGTESTVTATIVPSQTTTSERSTINGRTLERLTHEEINSVRADHGLSSLSQDDSLAGIARYHSKDMIDTGYFAHTSPSGETMGDRYGTFGYNCRVELNDGSGQYVTGGENIIRVEFPRGYYSEEELASEFVSSWMDSPGHRENILKPYWESEGIGVVVREDGGQTRVYATQNFC